MYLLVFVLLHPRISLSRYLGVEHLHACVHRRELSSHGAGAASTPLFRREKCPGGLVWRPEAAGRRCSQRVCKGSWAGGVASGVQWSHVMSWGLV